MSSKFLLGNMLSAILNKSSFFDVPVVSEYNNLCNSVLNVLYNSGYIKTFDTESKGNIKKLIIYPALDFSGKKVIREFKFYSTPGRRFYVSLVEVKKILARNPYKLYLISTSNGVMSAVDCIKSNLGGELLCEIF